MKDFIVILLTLSLVGCVNLEDSDKTLKRNEFENDTFLHLGCLTKLLPLKSAVVVCVPKTFWTVSDVTVLNSFSKEEWGKIFLLLSRIPTDCIHESSRMVELAYCVVYTSERVPFGVSVSFVLGQQVILRRDKHGHWRIINIVLEA